MLETSIAEKAKDIQERCQKMASEVKGPFLVRESEQLEAINCLLPLVDHKHVIFFFYLKKCVLKHVHGAQKWLGYSDAQFGMFEYFQCLNTPMIKEFFIYGTTLVEECLKGKFKDIGFMRGSYNTCHSLKDFAGNCYYVQRSSAPFQFNEERQITEYVNIIKLIKPYEGEPFYMETDNLPTEYLKHLKGVTQEVESKGLFSDAYLRLIEVYIERGPISERALSEELNISISAIKKAKQRIKAKVKEVYGVEHRFFIQTVAFLKREGVYYSVQKS